MRNPLRSGRRCTIRRSLLILGGLGCLFGSATLAAQALSGFNRVATLDVGRNPHQIWFSSDSRLAFVAAAGSDRITVLETAPPRVVATVGVSGTPLGVVQVPGREDLLVSRFGAQDVIRINLAGDVLGTIETGGGTSLFTGPLPNGLWLVSSERTNRLWILSPEPLRAAGFLMTGNRPFPPSVTSDGKLAFVPNYDDGSVTVVDLVQESVLETVPVGQNPSGGAVLPGDGRYVVAVRGENRLAFIAADSREVVAVLGEGIGDSPFSVVTTPDGRFGFVNNTKSHDISVLRLADDRVIGRFSSGEIPIVMAVFPDGRSLWVSCEGTHQLDVFSIPAP